MVNDIVVVVDRHDCGYGLWKVIWRLLVGLRRTQNIWAASKDHGRSLSDSKKGCKRRDDTILEKVAFLIFFFFLAAILSIFILIFRSRVSKLKLFLCCSSNIHIFFQTTFSLVSQHLIVFQLPRLLKVCNMKSIAFH